MANDFTPPHPDKTIGYSVRACCASLVGGPHWVSCPNYDWDADVEGCDLVLGAAQTKDTRNELANGKQPAAESGIPPMHQDALPEARIAASASRLPEAYQGSLSETDPPSICRNLRACALGLHVSHPLRELAPEAADVIDEIYGAAMRVLNSFNACIEDAAEREARAPVFDGMAELANALAKARGEQVSA